jgi:hypothetical protein
MTLLTLWLCVMGAFALVVFLIYAQTERLKLPVRFASVSELTEVALVAAWARKHCDRSDPRSKAITAIWSYLWLFMTQTRFGARISAQDLAFLAPFIEQFIAGNGPAPILSAEYEDERPACLGAFKARMQAEGLWPCEAVAPDATTES